MLWTLFCPVDTLHPFMFLIPTNTTLSIFYCINASSVIALLHSTPSQFELITASLPSHDMSVCQTGAAKVLSQSVKIHYGLTRQLSLLPSPSSSESGTRVGQGEGRGGGKRKWQAEKTILPFEELVVCESFEEKKGGAFLEPMLSRSEDWGVN